MTQVTSGRADVAPVATAGRISRGDTRRRILDTALAMFAEHGYAGTSVRDIAEELGITKAAVHYHFSAKEQLVEALLEPMLERLEAVVAAHATGPANPRNFLLGVRDVLVASGPLLSVLGNDPSVSAPSPELHARFHAQTERAAEVLAGRGAGADRVLRAHCALGAFLAGWKIGCGRPPGGSAGRPDEREFEVVLSSALAALGPASG